MPEKRGTENALGRTLRRLNAPSLWPVLLGWLLALGLLLPALDALALFAPFRSFVGGMFSVSAIVYYLSVTALFLFLTGQALERRRWN